jgi:hypothetical protein
MLKTKLIAKHTKNKIIRKKKNQTSERTVDRRQPKDKKTTLALNRMFNQRIPMINPSQHVSKTSVNNYSQLTMKMEYFKNIHIRHHAPG